MRTGLFSMCFLIATSLLACTFLSESTPAEETKDKNIAYVICAKDKTENKINRDLGNETVMCVKGHPITEILCPKDHVVNKLRNEDGALNTQCIKDGASIIMLPQDRGPDKIEETVLKTYPDSQQERYRLFSKKCSKCHSLARSLNSNFNAGEWQKYVKRMLRRPGSDMKKSDAKKIYLFLKFYAGEKVKAKKG